MKKQMRALACLVLAVLFSASTVSCGQTVPEEEGNTAPSAADSELTPDPGTETEPEEEGEKAVLPDKTFDGEQVMFLVPKHTGFDWYTSYEIYAEELNGTLINDAVFTRNSRLEEMLDVKIAETKDPDCYNIALKSVKADEDTYSVVMPYINSTITMATEGLLMDLKNVPWIDLEKHWWDQRANENLLIADKLFITTGDISILDNECTMVMFFNKAMIGDHNLENPYELVREKRWTLDKVKELALAVSRDADGDGKMTLDDVWGLSIAGNAPISFYFGAGERIVAKNEDGVLDFCLGSARSVDVFDKLMDVCLNDMMLSDHTTGDAGYNTVARLFNASQVMMVTFALVDINGMREAEFEFGILPYPLFDETQGEYNNLISTGLVTSVSVPITCPNTEVTGATLEAMAYLSTTTLTPAYYDNALKTRYVRDEESGEMLDIIFATRVYDLGFISNWGTAGNLVTTLYSGKNTNFSSMWAKFEKKARKDLEKALAAYEALE